MSVAHFFELARERESIRALREAGEPWPWSEDLVFRDWRFCNVFREEDKVTKWVKKHVRDPLDGTEGLVPAVAMARLFNWIPTLEKVMPVWMRPEGWTWKELVKAARSRPTKNVTSGAYIVKTIQGEDKAAGVIHIVRDVWADRKRLVDTARSTSSLEAVHKELQRSDNIGKFIAYEIVTDLRHTSLLKNATDILSWASFGPGAARGLAWIYPHETWDYNKTESQGRMLARAKTILERSLFEFPNRQWEMRDVEHWLCEYDKYRRVAAGGHLKRKFAPPTQIGGSLGDWEF
jgi:hypothetical protein